MDTYWSLTDLEREAIEYALDTLRDNVRFASSLKLANDDRAARAAESLAVYITESRRA